MKQGWDTWTDAYVVAGHRRFGKQPEETPKPPETARASSKEVHRFLIRESHQISSSNLQRKYPLKAIDSRTPKNIGVEIKPMELSATTKNEKETIVSIDRLEN